MERENIIKEYIQLRNLLNRSNKLSNERSELSFEIIEYKPFEYRLFAILESDQEAHKLALAERNRQKIWERTGFTKFKNLEDFCALSLNNYEYLENKSDMPMGITSDKLKAYGQNISNIFADLFLNQSYEP